MAQPPGSSQSTTNPDLARLQAALIQSGYSGFPGTLPFSPFFPTGGAAGAFHPGLSGWMGSQNSAAAAQMFNLAAMQQAAMLPLLGLGPTNSTAGSGSGSITDSFADFLKNAMPQAPSPVPPSKGLGRSKASSHRHGTSEAGRKEDEHKQSKEGPPRNSTSGLDTLAVVASAIKSYDKTSTSQSSGTTQSIGTLDPTQTPLTMDLTVNSSRGPSKDERQRKSRKMARPEKTEQQEQHSPVKRKVPRMSEPGNDTADSILSGSVHRGSENVRVDPQLLNASAAAWAALSNQLLFGSLGLGAAESSKAASEQLQNGLLSVLGATASSSSSVSSSSNRRRKSGAKTPSGRSGEPRVGSASEPTQEDKMDETIERVIRDSAPPFSSSLLHSGPPLHHMKEKQSSRPSSKGTSRSRRESHNGPGTWESPFEGTLSPAPLDLSCKPSSLHSDTSGDLLSRNASPAAQTKKRRVVEETSVRIPLALGWRRQTCVRNISGNGVRGDVIYYAPCGKKLGSYAEVMRYLSKKNIRGMSREHFSFSCKVLVGEFLLIRPDSLENGILTLSEEELLEKVAGSGKRSRAKSRPTSDDPTPSSQSPATTSESPLDLASPNSSAFFDKFSSTNLYCDETSSQNQALERPTSSGNSVLHGSQVLEDYKPPERNAAQPAEGGRTKPLRQPIEDMDIRSDLKMLPVWKGIENLAISAPAFADILMVMEFIHNFAHVLKIDVETDIPSLDEIHQGLLNHPDHIKSLRHLTKLLLILVLEYPGLKTGQGKTLLGQNVRDLKVTKDNQSELLRLFLQSRDSTGKELAVFLEHACFEYCTPDTKAAILAFMCNELLYCRNVVREIEGNIEEVARLKGDRWLKEGKARSLRALQAKKRVMAAKVKKEPQEAGETEKEMEKLEDGTEVKQEPTDDNASHDPDENSDIPTTSEELPIVPIRKAMPPGVGLPEILSEEEEAMSVEELDTYVHQLMEDAAELKGKIIEANSRVRTQPLGEDRYHRQYWCLRECQAFLVESPESSGLSNPAWNSGLHRSFEDESDAFILADCVKYLVDTVAVEAGDHPEHRDNSEIQEPSSSSKRNFATGPIARWDEIPSPYRRGWWDIKTKEELGELVRSLRSKGIRERLLTRVLARIEDVFQFDQKKGLCLSKADRSFLSSYNTDRLVWEKVLREVRNLEAKICHANVHCRGFKSDGKERTFRGQNNAKKSKGRILCSETAKRPQCIEELKAEAKKRLLDLELAIERRYIRRPFHDEEIDPDNVISTSGVRSSDSGEEESQPLEESSSKQSEESQNETDETGSQTQGVPVLLEKWREGVASANTAAQLTLAITQLDANVAWEKSIMKASCQICRSGDNESELLLCDGCDMGFHTYCFKPQMSSIPDGDWFCPSCLSRATDEPCCLICWKTTGHLQRCAECDREFHAECIGLPASAPDSPAIEDNRRKTRLPTAENQSPRNPWTCVQCSKNSDTIPSQIPDKKTKAKPSGKKSTNKKGKSEERDGVCANENGVHEKEAMVENLKILHAELEAHKDSWPFKLAVDTKTFPLYKKVIKRPMDFSLIQEKLRTSQYVDRDSFATDVGLIFDNCRVFNEDDSPVGKAGHTLKRFFLRRWKELFGDQEINN